MKKNLLLMLILLLSAPGFAQTEFLNISYEQSIELAKKENKLVFIDFYTDWCGPCKMMMREIFPQKIVGDYINNNFIAIKLNGEKEGKDLISKYEVKAYPTFLVIDASEKVIMTKVGASGNAKQFITSISRQIDPDKTPERMKDRYESGERTPDLISSYAGYLVEESQSKRNNEDLKDKAFTMVNEYFNTLSNDQKLAEENIFIYTSFTESPIEEAGKFMISNVSKFPEEAQPQIKERIDFLYKYQTQKYLMGESAFDSVQYNEYKTGLIDFGMNADNSYTPVFKFIETHALCDTDSFLTLCENDFSSLSTEMLTLLLYQFSNLLPDDNDQAKLRGAKFIRSLLPSLDANTIYWTATQLMKLENGDKH